MTISFDRTCMGISFDSKDVKPLENLFEKKFNEDENAMYVSKEIFTHDLDDGFKFKYQYAIECLAYGEDKAYNTYNLMLVPTTDSLCESVKNRLSEDADIADMVMEGYCVRMGEEDEEFENWDSRTDFNKTILENLAYCVPIVDRIRGVYLDKPWNAIGTNGWDMLGFLVNGKDLFAK